MLYNSFSLDEAFAARARFVEDLLMRLRQSVRQWIAYRSTRSDLNGLPDDVLRDIGLSRCEIDYVAARLAEAAEAGLRVRRRH